MFALRMESFRHLFSLWSCYSHTHCVYEIWLACVCEKFLLYIQDTKRLLALSSWLHHNNFHLPFKTAIWSVLRNVGTSYSASAFAVDRLDTAHPVPVPGHRNCLADMECRHHWLGDFAVVASSRPFFLFSICANASISWPPWIARGIRRLEFLFLGISC